MHVWAGLFETGQYYYLPSMPSRHIQHLHKPALMHMVSHPLFKNVLQSWSEWKHAGTSGLCQKGDR